MLSTAAVQAPASAQAQAEAVEARNVKNTDKLLREHECAGGGGLQEENEWSSEKQRLATFVSWPHEKTAEYPDAQQLAAAGMCYGVGMVV